MADQKLVFFCFDSSRTGDLARGAVEPDQLLHVGTSFGVDNARGRLSDHLKIALVHHHPYPYTPEREIPIIDPRSWVGREELIEFRGAPGFLSWCAARGIGLVLHGHKHIPRLVHDRVAVGPRADDEQREITTVGCGSSLGANSPTTSSSGYPGRRAGMWISSWPPGTGVRSDPPRSTRTCPHRHAVMSHPRPLTLAWPCSPSTGSEPAAGPTSAT